MLRNVYLHGPLARFALPDGTPYRLDVPNAAKAAQLLAAQIPGFRATIRDLHLRVVGGRDMEDGIDLAPHAVTLALGSITDIHLVPTASGAGSSKGIITTVIGVVLIAAAVIFSGGTAAGFGAAVFEGTGAAGLGLGVTYGQVAMLGVSLTLSGVSSMMAAQARPDLRHMEQADKRPSYLISSLSNRVEQGNIVPVVFGRCRAGSVVVSAGVEIVTLMEPNPPPASDPPDPNSLEGIITGAEGGWA